MRHTTYLAHFESQPDLEDVEKRCSLPFSQQPIPTRGGRKGGRAQKTAGNTLEEGGGIPLLFSPRKGAAVIAERKPFSDQAEGDASEAR